MGGNVYVGMVGSYGVDQTRLEAYTPNGKQLLKMMGLGFENHCAVSPSPFSRASTPAPLGRPTPWRRALLWNALNCDGKFQGDEYEKTDSYPAPFAATNTTQSIGYDNASRALFVAGFTPDLKNSVGGKQGFGRVLVRYAVAGNKVERMDHFLSGLGRVEGDRPSSHPQRCFLRRRKPQDWPEIRLPLARLQHGPRARRQRLHGQRLYPSGTGRCKEVDRVAHPKLSC